MNIPRSEDYGLFGYRVLPFDARDLLPHVATDLLVAGAYILLIFTIVYLNRRKYVSIYVPRNTYLVLFLVVFLLTFTASVLSVMLPAAPVHIGYKLFVATILFVVVLAILRVLPRRIDPIEQQRLQTQSIELNEARKANQRLALELQSAHQDVDRAVAERTQELARKTMLLEVDTAQQKLALERTAEAKRRLDELILRTNTALVFLDTDATILESNLALSQLVGRSNHDTLSGRSLGRLMGLSRTDELMHFLAETVRQGSFLQEIEVQPPARGAVTVEFSGATAMFDDKPCVMALIRDISDRRATERKLIENREALTTALEVTKKANATRSDFLAKMNHELRTPLNGIIGLSEILRFKAEGETMPAETARKLAGNIHQSGRHLLSVVDDLLDLSRLDAGAREFSPVSVVVRAEIDAALVTLGSIADKKRITIYNRCQQDFEWVVDQRALKQIVINLVNNAIKFSPPGTNVDVSVDATDNAMSLRIRDEGPGVTPTDKEKILAPFGRGEFAETHKIDGVGLGLTIVSELLKLQGGYIEIDSQPREGATFVAVFPKVVPTRENSAV